MISNSRVHSTPLSRYPLSASPFNNYGAPLSGTSFEDRNELHPSFSWTAGTGFLQALFGKPVCIFIILIVSILCRDRHKRIMHSQSSVDPISTCQHVPGGKLAAPMNTNLSLTTKGYGETIAEQLKEVRHKPINLTHPFLRTRDSFAVKQRHTFCDYELSRDRALATPRAICASHKVTLQRLLQSYAKGGEYSYTRRHLFRSIPTYEAPPDIQTHSKTRLQPASRVGWGAENRDGGAETAEEKHQLVRSGAREPTMGVHAATLNRSSFYRSPSPFPTEIRGCGLASSVDSATIKKIRKCKDVEKLE